VVEEAVGLLARVLGITVEEEVAALFREEAGLLVGGAAGFSSSLGNKRRGCWKDFW
jgi:hypothetical protein